LGGRDAVESLFVATLNKLKIIRVIFVKKAFYTYSMYAKKPEELSVFEKFNQR